MKFTKHLILFVLIFGASNMFGQLIVDDDLTPKGMAPEGTFAWEEGTTIPNLRFRNLRSETFNLHEKLDKLTIIEFWYIACESCVANKKYFKKFSNQYDINLISISVDEKASSVRKYLSDNNILWDNIHENNAFKSMFHKTLSTPSPLYLLVTPDKEIVKVFNNKSDIGRIGVYLQNYFK